MFKLKTGRPREVAQDIRRAVWKHMDANGLQGIFVKVLGDTAIVERYGGVLHITALDGGGFSLRYTGNALPETAIDRPEVDRRALEGVLVEWLHDDDEPGPARAELGRVLRLAAPPAVALLAGYLAYRASRRIRTPRPGRG